MGENSTGVGHWGFVVFLILLFWVFFGGGNFGNRGCGNGCITNCDVQKQGIIDSARNQFSIIDNARQVQDTVNAGNAMLAQKIDFYAYQDLRDQLAQERSKNIVLENRIYSDGQFNALSRQNENMFNALKTEIAELSCNVPKRPPYFAQGFVTCGQTIPNGCCGN